MDKLHYSQYDLFNIGQDVYQEIELLRFQESDRLIELFTEL